MLLLGWDLPLMCSLQQLLVRGVYHQHAGCMVPITAATLLPALPGSPGDGFAIWGRAPPCLPTISTLQTPPLQAASPFPYASDLTTILCIRQAAILDNTHLATETSGVPLQLPAELQPPLVSPLPPVCGVPKSSSSTLQLNLQPWRPGATDSGTHGLPKPPLTPPTLLLPSVTSGHP